MSNVIVFRRPDDPDDEDPIQRGDRIGRELVAEFAVAHAETGICFSCWLVDLTECGIYPLCDTFQETP